MSSADAIAKVAQNMPSQLLHSLSQVTSHQTPHYTHTPGGASSSSGYGGQSNYVNTVSGLLRFLLQFNKILINSLLPIAIHAQWSDPVHDSVHIADTQVRSDDTVDEWSVCYAGSADEWPGRQCWRIIRWWQEWQCRLSPVSPATTASVLVQTSSQWWPTW